MNALPVPKLRTLPRPAKSEAAELGEGFAEACSGKIRGISSVVGEALGAGEAETVGEGRGVPEIGPEVAETAAEMETLAELPKEIIF